CWSAERLWERALRAIAAKGRSHTAALASCQGSLQRRDQLQRGLAGRGDAARIHGRDVDPGLPLAHPDQEVAAAVADVVGAQHPCAAGDLAAFGALEHLAAPREQVVAV